MISGDYSMTSKVLVVIPYAVGNRDKAIRTRNIMVKRNLNVNFDINIIEDVNKEYYFTLLNRVWKKECNNYDWIIYAQDDLFPGHWWLSIALDAAKNTGKQFIAFNDGKWFGKNATVGMVSTSLRFKLYSNGNLFHPGYKQHGADPDLTERAKALGVYHYEPLALLVEVDYDKLLSDSKRLNQDDVAFYLKRKEEGFTWKT